MTAIDDCLVYVLKSPRGRVYVGITSKSLQTRWKQHVQLAASGGKFALHEEIRRCGACKKHSHETIEKMRSSHTEKILIRT